MKNQNNKAKANSLFFNNKDTKLRIECTLALGIIPMFEVIYQNRKITGFFDKSIWNDKEAIIKMAQSIIEARHKVQPFKIAK